jgi:hypothetical protein
MAHYKKLLPYPQLLFLIPPMAIYLLANVLFELSIDPLHPWILKLLAAEKTTILFDLSQSMFELKARYIWLASALINIVIPVVAIIFSVLIIIYFLKGIKLAWTVVIGSSLCILNLALLIYSSKMDSALYELVFGFTYNVLLRSNNYSSQFLHNIKTVIIIINILAAITPIFLISALCAILAIPAIHPLNQDPRDIIIRMHKLKELVNVGSVFLVFGILHMNMWLNWSAGLFGDTKLSTYISGVAWSISMFWGVTFTLVLAVTYLPASAYLQWQAWEQITSGALSKETKEAEAWMGENGFVFTFSNQLLQFIAILSPFLAAPISNFLKLP